MDSWSLLCTRRAATKPFLTWDGPEYSWAKQTKPGGGGPRCRGAGCGSAKGDWSRAPRTAGWRKLLYVRPRKRRGRHPTLVAVGSLRGRGPGHEKKAAAHDASAPLLLLQCCAEPTTRFARGERLMQWQWRSPIPCDFSIAVVARSGLGRLPRRSPAFEGGDAPDDGGRAHVHRRGVARLFPKYRLA
jgi:hypothetical protein